MKLISFLAPFTIMTLLTGFGRQTAINNERPAPGTTRTIVAHITYHSGNIEGSNTAATWPVAKFEADELAVEYSVKEIKTGKIYSWQQGETTQCAYHVFPSSQDMKNGSYYIGLGRTWSAETTMADPAWKASYQSSYGNDNTVEITYHY